MKLILNLLFAVGSCVAWVHGDCVPDWRAQEIVQIFEGLYTDGNVQKIKDTLTPDFTIYSDSQEFTTPNITPVSGAAVLTGRDAFIALYPPHPGAANSFVTLDTFHSCNKVAFRWVAPGGFGGKYPIRGIDTLDLVKQDGRWKIKTDYSEYNNVGFLAGIGVCTIC